jgi:hypothetical protein
VIPAVVEALADRLTRVLGERLVGVYLGGSFTAGDFVAASSDYDLLVVTEAELGEGDLPKLQEMHERLMREYEEADKLEGDYAPRQLLVPSGTSQPVPGFEGGRFNGNVEEIMLSADNIANMRASGIAVYGPAATTVLPEVTADDVRAAVLEMLEEGPAECDNEQQAANEVLNLVRSLCALDSGRPATKTEGVEWGLAHVDAKWHEVIRRADAIRRGHTIDEHATTLRAALPQLAAALRSRWTSRPGPR